MACQASDDLSLATLLSIVPQHFCCLSGMYNSFVLLSKVCCLRHLCCFQLLSFPQNPQFFLVSIQIHDVPRSLLVRFWRCLTLTVESVPLPDLQEQWKMQVIMPDSWVLIQHSGRWSPYIHVEGLTGSVPSDCPLYQVLFLALRKLRNKFLLLKVLCTVASTQCSRNHSGIFPNRWCWPANFQS